MREQNQNSQKIYIKPKIAYKKLKTAQKANKNVYIRGMLGYGKTSLVQNFLKNEEYLYYSAQNGFLEPDISQMPDEPRIIVFDDIAFLTNEYEQQFIRQQLAREDCFIIMLGRSHLPKWLKLCYYDSPFLFIEEDDLKMTYEDSLLFFHKHGLSLEPEIVTQIYKRTKGYPVIASMLALHLKNGMTYGNELFHYILEDFNIYLEYELFQMWDSSLYNFVLQLSIVDSFNYKLAEMITGRDNVPLFIEKILETSKFLSEEKGEFYMPPFLLNVLRSRLIKEYTTQQRNNLYYNAGLYYEMNHQFVKALNFYKICNNQSRILDILTKNIEGNFNTSNLFELRNYYFELSEEQINDSVPLMAGMSMLYSILMQPEKSEHWYRSLKKFEKKQQPCDKKEARIRLAYLDVALPHRGSHKVKEILISLSTLISNRHICLPEFSVTTNIPSVMNGGKDFCSWSLYDRTLAAVINKPIELALGAYGKGFANIALGESLFEKGTDLYEVTTLLNKGRCQAENGGKLEMCFVVTGLLLRIEVQRGQLKNAQKLLDDFYKRILQENALHLLPNFKALECRLALCRSDHAFVAQWLNESPQENVEFSTLDRYIYLTKIRVYFLEGNWEPAFQLIQRLLYYAKMYERTYIHIETMLALAIYEYHQNLPQWKNTFHEVLLQTQYYHFVPIISEWGYLVLPLLRKCKHHDIENAYYQDILEKTQKMAKQYPNYLTISISHESEFSSNALEILRMQSEGMTAKAIAQALHITEATVRYHSKTTYSKLNATGKMDAVRIAKERNLI